MLVIAHRGANKEAFENSWTAFEKAVEAGSHRIELDVQLTKDGHLVILHDQNLQHSIGLNKKTTELTRDEFHGLKLKNDESVPFLDEFLDRFLSRVEVNIEIKPDEAVAAKKVMDLLKGKNFHERVIISSFRPQPLIYLADNHPDVPIACLWGDYIKWSEASFFAPTNFMSRVRTKIFHPWTGYLNADVMDQARNRGWIVYPYVGMKGEDKNRHELWTYLKTLGIDGLCTNYPRELVQWLKEKTIYEQRHSQAQ